MDRNDRQVVIEKVNFDRHTTGSHRSRVEYLDCLSQILKNPDEVWINNERAGKPYDNYTLIKYYRDEVVVVCCRISDGELNTVRTWFPLRMKKRLSRNTGGDCWYIRRKPPVKEASILAG